MPNSAFRPITPRIGDLSYVSSYRNVRCVLFISVQPADASVNEGDDADFFITAQNFSDTGLSFQWQVSDDGMTWSNLTDGADYGGVTTDTLHVIDAPLELDGKQYRCTISSSVCELESSPATLSVADLRPNITVQPVDASIIETEDAEFSVTATVPVGTITYQWQVSTDDGMTWTPLSNDSTYSGVTTDTLAVTAAGAGLDGHQYRSVLSNMGFDVTTDVATLTVLAVALTGGAFTSESGSATLVGFSEFVSPSTPPKKYRHKATTGELNRCHYGNATDCANQVNVVGSDRITGGLTCQYDATTGALSSTGGRSIYVGATCPATPLVNTATDCGWGMVASSQLGLTVTPTQQTEYVIGQCILDDFYSHITTDRQNTISDEDTEDDAIARATPSGSGSSAMSKRETRGAGDFTLTWQDSTFGATAANLVNGVDYEVTLDLLTETYGGGSGVTTQLVYPFTASGSTEPISIPIPCAPGKQVTASNPQIAPA